jgi:hypothetical protein
VHSHRPFHFSPDSRRVGADLVVEVVPHNPKIIVSVTQRDAFVLLCARCWRRVSFSTGPTIDAVSTIDLARKHFGQEPDGRIP